MNREKKPIPKAIRNNKKNRARTVPVEFEELCDTLNKGFSEARLAEIQENITQFEIFEKTKPGSREDNLLILNFVAYATLKQTPPDFILRNYYMNEARFRNLVMQRFPLRKVVEKSPT